MVIRTLGLLVVILAPAAPGCVQGELEDALVLQELDPHYFRCAVEPVLVKRCAFTACHGSQARSYRVYAPHRLRLNASAGSPLSAEEHQANYDQSRALAGGGQVPRLLLFKALDARVGGYFHRGDELYGGGDVFQSVDDPGFVVLEAWTQDNATAASDCAPAPELGQ